MRKLFYYVALGTIIALAGCSKDAGSADVGPSSSISGGTGGEGSGPTGTGGRTGRQSGGRQSGREWHWRQPK